MRKLLLSPQQNVSLGLAVSDN